MSSLRESRKQSRRPAWSPQGFFLRHLGREVPAKLVDASEGGVGVETFVALPVGTLVGIQGELYSEGFSIEMDGEAQVRHCVCRDDGIYRVGLSFQCVAYRNLDAVGAMAGRLSRAGL